MFTILLGSDEQRFLDWIIDYIKDEGFSKRHLDAIAHIVGLFNLCEESEKEIFEFADKLYKKYAE